MSPLLSGGMISQDRRRALQLLLMASGNLQVSGISSFSTTTTHQQLWQLPVRLVQEQEEFSSQPFHVLQISLGTRLIQVVGLGTRLRLSRAARRGRCACKKINIRIRKWRLHHPHERRRRKRFINFWRHGRCMG